MSSRLLQLAVGLDLSTQQLKVVAIDITSLETFYEKSLVFDSELAHYKTTRGVYHNDQQHEVYSPVEMWIEAVDVIFKGMREDMFPFEKVVAISGAGQVLYCNCREANHSNTLQCSGREMPRKYCVHLMRTSPLGNKYFHMRFHIRILPIGRITPVPPNALSLNTKLAGLPISRLLLGLKHITYISQYN